MKMSINTPKQEHKSAEYDGAPSRASEYNPDAPGYQTPYSKDEVKTSELHPDHTGSENESYSQQEKYADYARYREQDRIANASGVQGEFAGYDMPKPLSDEEIRNEALEIVATNANVDTSQVLIEVKDGQVTLRGNVISAEIRDWIDNAVHTIPGVRRLDDQLLTPESTQKSP